MSPVSGSRVLETNVSCSAHIVALLQDRRRLKPKDENIVFLLVY